MSGCYALLLDTVSIQEFIFCSNKLKENLGASHLVDELYHRYMACALCKVTERTFNEELENLESWKTSESVNCDCSKKVDIGYIGGGNALLFFQNEDLLHKFIKEWTKILLIHAPGITTSIAYTSFKTEPGKFRDNLDALFEILKRNKAIHTPITTLPRHGITAECRRSGLSAETKNKKINNLVSAGTNAKIEAADISKEDLERKYKNLLKDQYCFTNELEKLGGISGEDSHIAIVHIDGNDIGELFKATQNLKEIRNLSIDLDESTKLAFKKIIEIITDDEQYENIMKSLGFDLNSKDSRRHYPTDQDNRNILPIRPIILGGDDVTFVCDGKLGIYFSKIFIEEFEAITKVKRERLTTCAGVAIIKTKYPFYRGVALANELCEYAKRIRKKGSDTRNRDENASFLDFQVSMGGIDGPLQKIRDSYHAQQGKLFYRPFKVVPKTSFDEYGLDLLLECACQVQFKSDGSVNLPNNKINELREVLTLPEESARKFVQELEFRGRKLPEIKGYDYGDKLFQNGKTPFYDMIELLRFYPDFALKDFCITKNGAKP